MRIWSGNGSRVVLLQIYRAIHAEFQTLGERTAERANFLLKRMADKPITVLPMEPEAEIAVRFAAAHAQAMAESSMIAVARYVAATEPTSPES